MSSITVFPSVTKRKIQADIMLMYANSDNFPDESVTTIIDSIFASFGIKFEYYNYDGVGNSKWRSVAGLYALTSDSIDMWGNEYDYNGTQEGIGNGERFSLKIRAWKQPEWADAPLIDADVINSSTSVVEEKIKLRGPF